MEVKIVKTKKDLKKFINFPFSLYKNVPYWVPPLISDDWNTFGKKTNPAYEFCEAEFWMVHDGKKIVGRIAGIINHRYNEIWGRKAARFCWIDFIDDPLVSGFLLGAVETWAREKGMDSLHGPLGFTDFDRDGLQIEGFTETATIALSYNHPYYQKHIEDFGFLKEKDWLEYDITTPAEVPEKVIKIQELVLKRSGLRLVPGKTVKELMVYAVRMFQMMNEAYKNLFGFVPLTEKQINNYLEQFAGLFNPDFIKIIVDANDRIVAAGLSLPSLSEALQKSKGRVFPLGFPHFIKALKHPKILDLYLIGILPEYQGRGVNAILMTEITRAAIRYGIKHAESLGELEDNKAVQDLWKHYEARNHKRRRCFVKKL